MVFSGVEILFFLLGILFTTSLNLLLRYNRQHSFSTGPKEIYSCFIFITF